MNKSLLFVPAGLAVLIAAGCGGGGSPTATQISGPPTLPDAAPLGTAKVTVNVETGETSVVPLGGSDSRAVFSGSAVTLTTTRLVEDTGEATRRIIKATFRNGLNETIGAGPGLEAGIRGIRPMTAPPLDRADEVILSTTAGTGASGSADGPAQAAAFSAPSGMAYDPATKALFVCDGARIRRILDGLVTTTVSGLSGADGLVLYDGFLYFCQSGNHTVARASLAGGPVQVVAGSPGVSGSADGPGLNARFSTPRGLALVDVGNPQPWLVVADTGNSRVRIISSLDSTPSVSTMATGLNTVTDVAGYMDHTTGHTPYVAAALFGTNQVALIRATDGAKFLIGTGALGSIDGAGNSAQFNHPWGLAVMGRHLVVSEEGTGRIRWLGLIPGGKPESASSWFVSRFISSASTGFADGIGTAARTGGRVRFAALPNALQFSDALSFRVRHLEGSNGWTALVEGGGWSASSGEVLFASASFLRRAYPSGSGELEHVVRLPQLAAGESATVDWAFTLPSPVKAFEFIVTVTGAAGGDGILSAGAGQPTEEAAMATVVGMNGVSARLDGVGAAARLVLPRTVCVDEQGNVFWVDETSGIDHIRVYNPRQGRVSTLVGTRGLSGITATTNGWLAGPASITGMVVLGKYKLAFSTPTAIFSMVNPTAEALGASGDEAWMDAAYWEIALISGDLTLTGNIFGELGTARYTNAKLAFADAIGSLYIIDNGHQIRKLIDRNRSVPWVGTTAAGFVNGMTGQFNTPTDLCQMADGSFAVADSGNNAIRRATPEGIVTTLAGDAAAGYVDGLGGAARFAAPRAITVDRYGMLYVLEASRLRRVSPRGDVRTVLSSTTFRDGRGSTAGFGAPWGVEASPFGDLYITDGPTLRRVSRIVADN